MEINKYDTIVIGGSSASLAIAALLGKKGKNVNALRTLLSAATAKAGGKRALLEIIE